MHEGGGPREPLEGVLGSGVEAAEGNRRLAQGGGEPDIVVDEEAGDVPGHLLHILEGKQIGDGGLLAAHLVEQPG